MQYLTSVDLENILHTGANAAILKFNGASDEVINDYIMNQLDYYLISDVPNSQVLPLARKSYSQTLKSIKLGAANNPGKWVCLSWHDELTFFKPEDIDKVTSAKWIKRYIK